MAAAVWSIKKGEFYIESIDLMGFWGLSLRSNETQVVNQASHCSAGRVGGYCLLSALPRYNPANRRARSRRMAWMWRKALAGAMLAAVCAAVLLGAPPARAAAPATLEA